LFFTVLEICSIEAAVCCRLLACSSVRWLRSALPEAICEEPVAMLSLLLRTWPTMRARLACISPSEFITLPAGAPAAAAMGARLPAATCSAAAPSSAGSAPSERVRLRPSSQLTSPPTMAIASASASITVEVAVAVDRAESASVLARSRWKAVDSSTALKITFCLSRTSPVSSLAAPASSPFASSASASSILPL